MKIAFGVSYTLCFKMQVTYNFFLIQVKFSTFKSSKETPGIQPGICSARYLLLIWKQTHSYVNVSIYSQCSVWPLIQVFVWFCISFWFKLVQTDVVVKRELSAKERLTIYLSIHVPPLTYGYGLQEVTKRIRFNNIIGRHPLELAPGWQAWSFG